MVLLCFTTSSCCTRSCWLSWWFHPVVLDTSTRNPNFWAESMNFWPSQSRIWTKKSIRGLVMEYRWPVPCAMLCSASAVYVSCEFWRLTHPASRVFSLAHQGLSLERPHTEVSREPTICRWWVHIVKRWKPTEDLRFSLKPNLFASPLSLCFLWLKTLLDPPQVVSAAFSLREAGSHLSR